MKTNKTFLFLFIFITHSFLLSTREKNTVPVGVTKTPSETSSDLPTIIHPEARGIRPQPATCTPRPSCLPSHNFIDKTCRVVFRENEYIHDTLLESYGEDLDSPDDGRASIIPRECYICELSREVRSRASCQEGWQFQRPLFLLSASNRPSRTGFFCVNECTGRCRSDHQRSPLTHDEAQRVLESCLSECPMPPNPDDAINFCPPGFTYRLHEFLSSHGGRYTVDRQSYLCVLEGERTDVCNQCGAESWYEWDGTRACVRR